MASITRQPNGHKTVQFVGADRKRRSVRLGKCSMSDAKTVKSKIEALAASAMMGNSPDPEIAIWVGSLDAVMYDKLAGVGLVPEREAKESAKLGDFITAYIASRTDVKPATKEVWRQGELGLVDFFGKDRALAKVTPGHADNYKRYLIAEKGEEKKKLAPMTVRKRLQFATMIFRAAVRNKLISANPFADVGMKATMPDRRQFISRADTAKLLKACPSHEWRTIIALARYGGLRCPSEVLSLKWQGVDWEHGKLLVASPKTEHHAGKAERIVPLFPELYPILLEASELAPEGAVYVVNERFRRGSMGPAGWRGCNLRTTFEKIIKRAGLTPWPRLFHNLRSTRQTELAETFPAHVVCAWLGNSEDVAREHYLQVTDAHFERAASAVTEGEEKAVQNPVQQPTATRCNAVQLASAEPLKTREKRGLPNRKADGEGFEPPVQFPARQFSRLLP